MERTIKLLLLEDNLNDVELIRHQISKSTIKYHVKHVSQYVDFSYAIEEYRPDIILSDYNLIGFTGMDALELVKQKCRLTPFIIVTGSIDEEAAANTIKKGAWDYIVKERLSRLNSAMKNALQLKVEQEKSASDREKLKVSEERYKLAIDGSRDGIWDWDLKSDEVFFSSRWKSMLGYDEHEIENSYKAWEDLLHPEDKHLLQDTLNPHLKKETTAFQLEYRLKCKDGSYKWIFGRGKALYDRTNTPYRIAGSHTDISERKLMEIELIRAKDKAEESDRLKSAFLANMSHEIRTPMNGILGFITLLNEPDLSPDEIQEYSSIITKSSELLLNTINDIINISKIEAGEMIVLNSETSINKMMQDLLSFHTPEANQKGLSLILEPLSEEFSTVTDKHKLHGILTNLLKNATKYTDTGSITFGCTLLKSAESSVLEFFVKDTGIGIPEDRIHAIFNRFEQAEIDDTRVFEGSGLGLAISKAYAKILGGEIFVESAKGVGSKFSFTIPFTHNVPNAEEKPEDNETHKTTKIKDLKLLVVEDDTVSAHLLEKLLQNEFHKITFVKTGLDAIEACRNNPDIDLILMDIKLPLMNGFDTTREIRTFNKKVVIIAQTAYAMADDKEKAIDAGCSAYITKPIIKTELLKLIADMF